MPICPSCKAEISETEVEVTGRCSVCGHQFRESATPPEATRELNQGEEVKLHLRTSIKTAGPIVIIVAVLLQLTILLRPTSLLASLSFLIWYISRIRSKQYFITTDRVILYRKFFRTTYRRDIYYEQVREFKVGQGICARFLGYGSIQLYPSYDLIMMRKAWAMDSDRIINVPNPDRVYSLLQSLRLTKIASKSLATEKK